MDGVTNVTGTQPIARRTFSPSEIAAATSLSLQTIRKMIRLGELKAVRVRRRLLIPADELDRLCELK
jgi:excisionase family DNA binding protein